MEVEGKTINLDKMLDAFCYTEDIVNALKEAMGFIIFEERISSSLRNMVDNGVTIFFFERIPIPMAFRQWTQSEFARKKDCKINTISRLEGNCFIIIFSNPDDWDDMLSISPYKYMGRYVHTKRWNSLFNPLKPRIPIAPIWVVVTKKKLYLTKEKIGIVETLGLSIERLV